MLAGAGVAAGALLAATYLTVGDRIALDNSGGISGDISGRELDEGDVQDLFGASDGATGGVIGSTGKALIGGPFRLITSQGSAFSEQDLEGSPSVIVFGLLDRDGLAPPAFNAIEKSLSEIGRSADNVRIIFVALDGRPDDLGSLVEFAREHPGLAIAATGDDDALLHIAKTFKFYLRKDHQRGEAASVSYAPFLFIMDAEGQYTSHARLPTDAGTLNPLIRAVLD